MTRSAVCVVWGIWATLSLLLPMYVLLFASSIPVVDDWELVPPLTFQGPHGAAWLWLPHNEHRIPLPKLLLLGLAWLFGFDPRAGLYLNAAALSALSAALILTSRRLRGTTRWTDALFPLALLHWGQYVNLLVSVALNLVSAACLSGAVLALLVRIRGRPTLVQNLAIGLLLICLPLCGASGLVFVPSLAMWLCGVGIALYRTARGTAVMSVTLAMLSWGVVGLYFTGSQLPSVPPAGRSARGVLTTAEQFLAMSLGPLGKRGLPFSALLLAGLALVTATLLVLIGQRQPPERWRSTGLLAYAGALAMLTAAVAWGRASVGGVRTDLAGTRFVTSAAVLLCWLYLSWTIYRDRFLPAALCIVMGLLLPWNMLDGYRNGHKQAALMQQVEQDVRAGLSGEQLAAKWGPVLSDLSKPPANLAERWEMLRRTHTGPYRDGAGD